MQPDQPIPPSEPTPSGSEWSASSSGVQVVTVDFPGLKSAVGQTKLKFKGNVQTSFEDIVSGIAVVEKVFQKQKPDAADNALTQVRELSQRFTQKAGAWRNQFQGIDGAEPKVGGQKLGEHTKRKLLAERNDGNRQLSLSEQRFLRLIGSLQQAAMMGSTQPEPAKPIQGQTGLPEGFVEAFQGAAPDARSDVVLAYFDQEAVLELKVRTVDGKRKGHIVPSLKVNRLYYLIDSSQIIRIRRIRITDVIHIHLPDSGEVNKMPVKQFADHVQKGVWLLSAKSAAG